MIDTKWILAMIVSIIAAIVPIGIFLIQTDRKQFSCDIISEVTILDPNNPALGQVQSFFKGRELKRLTAWTLRLKNSGSGPIRRESFDSPVILVFPSEVSLLTFFIDTSNPLNFRPKMKQNGNEVAIEPTLWNKDDSVTLQILTDGPPARFEVTARIAGISRVTISGPEQKSRRHAYLSLVLALLGAVGYGFFSMLSVFIFRRTRLLMLAFPYLAASILLSFISADLYFYANTYFLFDFSKHFLVLISLIFVYPGGLLAIPFAQTTYRRLQYKNQKL